MDKKSKNQKKPANKPSNGKTEFGEDMCDRSSK